MHNGWRGGEWSLLRAVTAAASAAAAFPPRGPAWDPGNAAIGVAITIAILVLAPALALGAGTRGVALALAALLASASGVPFLGSGPGSGLVPVLVVLAAAPPAPFGSWAARGRTDPSGGWRLPAWLRLAAPAVALLVLADFAARIGARAPGAPLGIPGLLAALLLGFDPGWIRRARAGEAPDTVFYDGTCGLCHRAARFILAEDDGGAAFRLAPVDGPAFERLIPPEARDALPDSVIVRAPDGRILVRSAAMIRIWERLGGFWRAFGVLARAVPRPLRDLLYDGVARIRKRLFATPKDACPLVPPELRTRFLSS